ncbi:hypothetical protein PAPYR_11691 [Paratrimastix pyriformis]|uniref:Uncharacterized protein n=1 Tax=Paratrimastix pyriformis TaxID=342808 RepID=A0ABQ8U609_9EUKA|nr:hypothetical protein PAPYR_11691 [Paratrimastix pyriformis]
MAELKTGRLLLFFLLGCALSVPIALEDNRYTKPLLTNFYGTESFFGITESTVIADGICVAYITRADFGPNDEPHGLLDMEGRPIHFSRGDNGVFAAISTKEMVTFSLTETRAITGLTRTSFETPVTAGAVHHSSAYAATISGTTNSVITYYSLNPEPTLLGTVSLPTITSGLRYKDLLFHEVQTTPSTNPPKNFTALAMTNMEYFCEVPLSPLGSARVVNISQHYFSGWDPKLSSQMVYAYTSPVLCVAQYGGSGAIIFDLSEHVAIRDFQNDESILSIISTSNTEFHVLGLTTLNVFFMRSPTDLTFPFFLPVRTQSYKLSTTLGLRPLTLTPSPGLFVSVEGASGIPDGEYDMFLLTPRTDNTTLISMQTAEINRGLSGALAEFAYAVYHQ